MPFFLATIILTVALIIANGLGRDADVKLAIHQSNIQVKLDAEQRTILGRLEEMNDTTVSEFVGDWRMAYPQPNAQNIQELSVIEQKIKNDVSSAGRYTLAAHREKTDRFNAVFSSPTGTTMSPKPGL